MNTTIWDANVELKKECEDHFDVIRNPRDALAYLLSKWPEGRGASQATARRACLGALAGTNTNAEARAAFEFAAREAGILRQN
ncbi:DUF982 domain-containing protein [Pararhizobium sp. DWP3-4]|uniref:DUF982 domain-containing protein n=1 Tax=Pararhizobium sp. DWP3-4 TaxID=2804565 RepID=UPI003CE6B410